MGTELNEAEMESSLEGYIAQSRQLEMALSVTTDQETRTQLMTLLNDMRELITLTQEGLLALKKSKLMAMFESPGPAPPAPAPPPTTNLMDDEFAAFQAAIAEDNSVSETPDDSHSHSSSPIAEAQMYDKEDAAEDDGDDGIMDDSVTNEHIGDELIGARCRVTYTHDWGERRQHNAMVVGTEPYDPESEPKVRVMFCNPTHRSLVPCPFYLKSRCRFENDTCRYSHGQIIPVDEVEEFQDIDHSTLKLESRCLARYKDDVWYPALVVEVMDGHKFKVMFDQYDNEAEEVGIEDIIPLDEDAKEVGSDVEDQPSQMELSDDEDEKDAVPVYLWRPNQTTDSLGDWEKHTKGFGSRMMARMGYITGQGLGKNCEGRAEPVPIQLLPPGKSLDKIMELKEAAGDRDLYDVTKKDKRKVMVKENKFCAQYKKAVGKERTTFDFINKKLTGKKGNLSDLVRLGPRGAQVERKTIAESELTKRSDKHINIQLLKTDEESRNVQKEIRKLKESLQRNDGKDKAMAAHVRQRLAAMETYLGQLKASSSSMQRHKQRRSDHKKLTKF